MRLIRNGVNFNDFLWLLKGGFWIFLIISSALLFIGTIGISTTINNSQAEYDIYAALRGEKTSNEIANKTADFLINFYKSEPITREQLHDIFVIWSEDVDRTNAKIIVKNWNNIKLILEKAPEAQSAAVELRTWTEVFVILGIIIWIILNFSLSLSYLSGSGESTRRRGNGNILTYPWNKIWAYPFIAAMLPFLILGQPTLLIIYAARKISRRSGRVGPEEEQGQIAQTEELSSKKSRPRSQGEIDADRRKYRREVDLAAMERINSQRQWIALCGQRLVVAKEIAENEIARHRAELMSLGQTMEETQRYLAGAKSRLKDIEEAIKNNTAAPADCELGNEFDKLSQIPEILEVVVRGEEILIYTDTLFVDSRWGRFELGDYLIRIHTRSCVIRVENRCNTSACGLYHPYAYGGRNQICFGTLSSYITKLCKQREYFGLIVALLRALQTNEGDHPEKIRYWKGVAQHAAERK